jgi:hypothetical protein
MVLSLKSVAAIGILGACLAWSAPAPHTVTWTGWFSDANCAAGRDPAGTFTATNPECAAHCIKEGAAAVFNSQQAKALFEVKGDWHVVDDLGYHVEVQGIVDESAKTITIQKVTRLGYDGASCARPKKPAAKQ